MIKLINRNYPGRHAVGIDIKMPNMYWLNHLGFKLVMLLSKIWGSGKFWGMTYYSLTDNFSGVEVYLLIK